MTSAQVLNYTFSGEAVRVTKAVEQELAQAGFPVVPGHLDFADASVRLRPPRKRAEKALEYASRSPVSHRGPIEPNLG